MNLKVRKLAMAMMAAIAGAAPASAADWWLIQDASGEQAVFGDVDTLARQGDDARLRVLRIDRAGRASERVEQIRCDKDVAAPLPRFACASDQERARLGLILAAMEPAEVARILFRTRPAAPLPSQRL